MAPQENIELVLRLYKAFARADIQTIVDALRDDVEWIESGGGLLPWAGVLHGHDEVAGCFHVLNELLENQEVYPREVLAQDDRVVVLGESSAMVRENGRRVDQEWVSVWTIADGKVKHYHYFDDTAKWLAALQSES